MLLWGSRAEHQPWAVMLPSCRGVGTPLEFWPHSVPMSTAQSMLPPVTASDLKTKELFFYGVFADHHARLLSF